MGKMMTFAAALVMAMLLTGCGGDSHEKVMGDMVGQMKEFAGTLETIKDEASAKAASDKLNKIAASMKDLKARADKLGKPSADVEKALKEKYEKDMTEVMGKFMGSAMRIGMNPELGKHVEKAMEEVGKSMK